LKFESPGLDYFSPIPIPKVTHFCFFTCEFAIHFYFSAFLKATPLARTNEIGLGGFLA
jgi:hypothetical protein